MQIITFQNESGENYSKSNKKIMVTSLYSVLNNFHMDSPVCYTVIIDVQLMLKISRKVREKAQYSH